LEFTTTATNFLLRTFFLLSICRFSRNENFLKRVGGFGKLSTAREQKLSPPPISEARVEHRQIFSKNLSLTLLNFLWLAVISFASFFFCFQKPTRNIYQFYHEHFFFRASRNTFASRFFSLSDFFWLQQLHKPREENPNGLAAGD